MKIRQFKKSAAIALAMALLTTAIMPSFAGVAKASSTTETITSTTASTDGQPGTPPSDGGPGGGGTPPSDGGPGGGGTPPSDGGPGGGGTPPSDSGTGSDNGAPAGGNGGAPGGAPGGGANTMTYDYTGTLSGALTADGEAKTSEGETYTASTADQNAALVQNSGTLTIKNDTFIKSGDDTNGDNCNFYGLNSILLAVNSNSAAYISKSSLSADSEGSNGIFSTDNATVYANDNTIDTTKGNSRGLDATYGGTIIANEMTISTQGDHSAAVATDRGGGSISVTNCTLSTAGSGSPLLYSTGDIEADNVTGTAIGSQIAGMEGYNTILIHNSTLTSELEDATASDPMADGIIIYQSTSGDAEASTGEIATFEASNSTLKSAIASGAMFYFTNTKANVVLSDTTLDFDSSKANLINIQGNDANNWGTAGSNGADVTFTGLSETLSGNIDVDTISSLNLYLLEGSAYTGTASISANAVNTNVSEAPITVNLDSTSKWVVTGDSVITNLNAEDGASIIDEEGKTVTIIANGKIVVTGNSSYTITVNGSYSEEVTTDSNNALSTTYIDRSGFDEYYALETTFGTNGTADAKEEATEAETEETVPETTAPEENTSNHASAVLYVVILAVIVLGGSGIFIYKRRK